MTLLPHSFVYIVIYIFFFIFFSFFFSFQGRLKYGDPNEENYDNTLWRADRISWAETIYSKFIQNHKGRENIDVTRSGTCSTKEYESLKINIESEIQTLKDLQSSHTVDSKHSPLLKKELDNIFIKLQNIIGKKRRKKRGQRKK